MYVKQNIATVLTACGIETYSFLDGDDLTKYIATVLTACGIETIHLYVRTLEKLDCNSTYRLRY